MIVAAAGAGARRLLDRQAEAEARISAQERHMAAEAERARLARDMHDSLAKTVSGIGFAALALSRQIERDPEGAAAEARRLADDARQATREAREIIAGLRTEGDEGGALPLPVALRAEAERWAAAQHVRLDLAIEDVGELDAVAARELEWILREALRNAERHARASSIAVRLRMLGGRAVLTIADDGDGFEVPDDLADALPRAPLRRHRHARARAAGRRRPDGRVGARGGLRAVRVGPGPRGAPRRAGASAPAAAGRAGPDHAEPSDTVPRAVPGYTWQ